VIAGAGDRALDAVAWGAAEVLAVDLAAGPLHLTALKAAAAGALAHDDLVRLFSVGRHADAGRLYAGLRQRLAPADRAFWDRWIDLFRIGLHEQSSLGVAVAAGGCVLRLVGGRSLAEAIQAADLETQRRVYESRLRRRYWNRVTRWLLGRDAVTRWYAPDPRERRAMLADRYAGWLEENVSRVIATSLVRENPCWMPLLAGRPVDPGHETAWLRPEAVDTVRGAPERLRPVRASVVDALARRPPRSLDAVALSNVPDWLSPADLDRLWAELGRTLATGGRAVMRSTLRRAPRPPDAASSGLIVDEAASSELTSAERTGIFVHVTVLVRAATPG
jgi:S-adenosylmethionine:diacylglycerol 3-amino-3-carboxypropyl transferase